MRGGGGSTQRTKKSMVISWHAKTCTETEGGGGEGEGVRTPPVKAKKYRVS